MIDETMLRNLMTRTPHREFVAGAVLIPVHMMHGAGFGDVTGEIIGSGRYGNGPWIVRGINHVGVRPINVTSPRPWAARIVIDEKRYGDIPIDAMPRDFGSCALILESTQRARIEVEGQGDAHFAFALPLYYARPI